MNYNKGKKLLSERFYLTWAGEQMSWTVRMTLKMKDRVDGDLLRKAVESTSQRYPYCQVKLGIRKDTEGTEYFVYEDTSSSSMENTLVMAATNSRIACQILSLIVSSWLS